MFVVSGLLKSSGSLAKHSCLQLVLFISTLTHESNLLSDTTNMSLFLQYLFSII